MYASVNEYEMRLPRGYVDSSAEEMEYDGIWSLKGLVASIAVGAVIGAAMVVAAPAVLGLVGVTAVSAILTGVGVGALTGAIGGAIGYPTPQFIGE